MQHKISNHQVLQTLEKLIFEQKTRLVIYCFFNNYSAKSVIQLSRIDGSKLQEVTDMRRELISNFWDNNPIISFFQSYPELLLSFKKAIVI